MSRRRGDRLASWLEGQRLAALEPCVRTIVHRRFHGLGGGNPLHGMERDDVLQAARLGALTALRTHDPTRCAFAAHLSFCVRRAVIDELRRCVWFGRAVRGAVVVTGEVDSAKARGTRQIEHGWLRSSFEPVAAPAAAEVEAEADFARVVRRRLRGREREAFTRRYLDLMTCTDVAREMGITQGRVSQLCQRAARKLEDYLHA